MTGSTPGASMREELMAKARLLYDAGNFQQARKLLRDLAEASEMYKPATLPAPKLRSVAEMIAGDRYGR